MPKATRREYNILKGMVSNNGNVYQQNDCVTAWYKLDENVTIIPGTTVAHDSSGNGHNGTYQSPDGGVSEGIPGFSYGPPRINSHSLRTGTVSSEKGGVYLPTAGNLGLSGGKPFSIQVWFKVDRVPPTTNDTWIIDIAVAGSSNKMYSISLDYNSSPHGRIMLAIFNDDTTTSDVISTSYGAPLGKWIHAVATFDGTNSRLYVDGELIGSDSTAPNIAAANVVSVGGSRVAAGLQYCLRGYISNVTIWSRALSHDSIKALAGATVGHYQIGSGLLNNPERVIIRDLDNMTGSYPTIARTTGIKGTVGNSPITPFNETRAVQFNKLAAMSNYPMVLNNVNPTESRTYAEDFNKNWIATPNISGSIDAPGNSKPFLSLQNLTPSIDQGINLTPFDESRINLRDTPFYLTGTSNSIMPGFSSRLADKIQIKIPLPNAKDKRMTRFNCRGISDEQPLSGSQFEMTASHSNTGFAYYNFDMQQWQDIGYIDPLTKVDLQPTFFYTEVYDTDQWEPLNTDPRWKNRGGGHYKRYQFGMSDHLGHRAGTYQDLIAMGYSHIGSTTLSGDAPASPSYHATSSQTLQLSDYIAHPFVLEKAVLEIPVTVRRMNGSRHPRDTEVANEEGGKNGMKQRMDCSVRDIDNYTFFMYRQGRTGVGAIDSKSDISGSQRFLVMSASAAFWNGPTFNSSVSSSIVSLGLPHTPAFSHDFNMPVSASYFFGAGNGELEPGDANYDSREAIVSRTGSMVSEYTGTLRLEMVPAVGSGKKGGGTRFSMRAVYGAGSDDPHNNPNPAPAAAYNNITVQDFWPGGTTVDVKVIKMPKLSSNLGFAFRKPVVRGTAPITPTTSSVQKFPNVFFSNKYKGLSPFNVRGAWFKEYAPYQGDRSKYGFGITGSMSLTIFQDGRALRNPTGLKRYTGHICGATYLTSSAPIATTTTTSMGFNLFAGGKFGNALINPGAEFRSAYEALRFGPRINDVPGDGTPLRSGGGYGTIVVSPDIPNSTESPYILMPEDRLVFGIDAGISTTPVSGTATNSPTMVGLLNGFTRHNRLHQISGSQMFIQSGSASITLFGSMIRENREKLFELNQPLTSPAIHEALHFDNPVVDQFLTEPRQSYSGSYTDNIVLGLYTNQKTTCPEKAFRDSTPADWMRNAPRAVYGYVSSGDRISDKYNDKAVYTGMIASPAVETEVYYTQPDNATPETYVFASQDRFGHKLYNNLLSWTNQQSRLQRLVKVSDYTERYYDTIMPHITDYCIRSGMSWNGGDIITGTIGGNLTEGTVGGVHHKYEYPYATNITRPLYDFKKFLFEVKGSSAKGQNASSLIGSIFDPELNTLTNGLALNAILFKKGAYEFCFPSGLVNTKAVVRWSPEDPEYPHAPYTKATGYAYGILDIRRKYTSAIFRSDRFGQFRDMIEQRQDAKFWMSDLGDPSINNQDGTGEFEGEFVIGFGEADGPVQCRFVLQEDGRTVISPYDTDSCNMSLEATSSMPYFDNLSRNVSSGSTDSSALYTDSYITPLGPAPWSGLDNWNGNRIAPSGMVQGGNPFTKNLSLNQGIIANFGQLIDTTSGGGSNCFVAGTKITMSDGSMKNIEDISSGDFVMSYNFDTESSQMAAVTSTVSPVHDDIVEFVFSNGVKTKHTYDHPYYVIGKGWCSYSPDLTSSRYSDMAPELSDVSSVEPGDKFVLDHGGNVQLLAINIVESGPVKTYNICVDINSNYFADGILVHNKTRSGGGPTAGGTGTATNTGGLVINTIDPPVQLGDED